MTEKAFLTILDQIDGCHIKMVSATPEKNSRMKHPYICFFSVVVIIILFAKSCYMFAANVSSTADIVTHDVMCIAALAVFWMSKKKVVGRKTYSYTYRIQITEDISSSDLLQIIEKYELQKEKEPDIWIAKKRTRRRMKR